MPNRVMLERNRFSPDTVALLKQHGYDLAFGGVGDGECIQVDLATGLRLGASDARNDTGKAVGY
jgi:gamma-glutamyltranspeptidase / glutathione hydrolase